MPAHPPEWISSTYVDIVQLTDGAPPQPVRLQVGLVRMPDEGGIRIASQVEGRPVFVLPPAAVAPIIGALYRALREEGWLT